MELTEEYFASRQLVAQIEKAKLVVQAVEESGISHIDNPARVTRCNDVMPFGDHSVAISHPHFDLIKDVLPEHMMSKQEKGSLVQADGAVFPGEFQSAIKTALIAKNIAWTSVYVSKKPW
jgi:hypothetical protein